MDSSYRRWMYLLAKEDTSLTKIIEFMSSIEGQHEWLPSVEFVENNYELLRSEEIRSFFRDTLILEEDGEETFRINLEDIVNNIKNNKGVDMEKDKLKNVISDMKDTVEKQAEETTTIVKVVTWLGIAAAVGVACFVGYKVYDKFVEDNDDTVIVEV